jgi:hypothetical protein
MKISKSIITTTLFFITALSSVSCDNEIQIDEYAPCRDAIEQVEKEIEKELADALLAGDLKKYNNLIEYKEAQISTIKNNCDGWNNITIGQ